MNNINLQISFINAYNYIYMDYLHDRGHTFSIYKERVVKTESKIMKNQEIY